MQLLRPSIMDSDPSTRGSAENFFPDSYDGSCSIPLHRYHELIQTQKSLCEAALRISDILQDSSRFASYRTAPASKPQKLRAQTDIPSQLNRRNKQDSSKPFRPTPSGVDINDNNNPSTKHSAVPATASPQIFELENFHARLRYIEQRKQNSSLYSGPSPLVGDYDFQCRIVQLLAVRNKFYSNTTFAQLELEQDSLGFDPLHWSYAVPQPSDIDVYNAFHQLDHGRRLQEAVRQRLPELMDALFPVKTRHVLQCMSWPELEYSYGVVLQRLIEKVGFGQCSSYLGFFDSDVTLLLIEVGRFFKEIDFSNRPPQYHNGIVPEAVGPYMNGEWPAKIRKEYTLQALHRRCHRNGLLRDWEDLPIRRVLLTGLLTTRTSQEQAEMIYILEVILLSSKGVLQPRPFLSPPTIEQSQEFILDYLQRFWVDVTHEQLEQSTGQVFAARLLHVNTIRRLGDISIVWTDCIDNHLRLSLNTKTLQLYWDVSLLEQSLLFWYNSHVLKKNMMHWSETVKRPQTHLLHELRCTYRLLFNDQSSEQFTFTEATRNRMFLVRQGIRVNDFRIDLDRPRTQHVLRHLLDTPLPQQLRNAHVPSTAPPPRKRTLISKLLPRFRRYHRPTKEPTIRTFLSQGPPYPLDLCWHLENILVPFPHYLGERDEMRSFASFPRFEDRLRELASYMDNQKPKGWYQMWKDRRDRVQHVTFWAVLVFGTISIVLALVGIAVGSAQTVAAFRALAGNNR
ncbi:MAG: hypothetical protein Q9225_002912 [Loekoesia sp. 1 TL-2023]